jgi:hypothetical protein
MGPQRRFGAAIISGLTLPLLAASAAIIFFSFQPVEKNAWSGLALGAVLALSLYAVPVCLGTALLTLYLPKRSG